jgi:O-antigen ligase
VNSAEIIPVHTADTPNGFVRYIRFAAIVTMLGYCLGYSAIGFAFLFFGAVWSAAARRRFLWTRTPLDLPLAVFGAMLLASAAASPFHRLALGVTLMLLISGAVYIGSFAWLVAVDPRSQTTLLRAWAMGAFIAAPVGLFYGATTYVASGPPGHFAHARAQIPHGVGPNGLGTTLLLGSVLALGFVLRTRGWERAGWAAGGLLTLAGLVATGSRASLAGCIIGAGYLLYRELRTRPRTMAAVTVLCALLVAGVVAATPQLANRLRDTVTDVNSNRVQIWHTSLGMVAERPLLGTGFGTFQTAYDQHRRAAMSPEPFAFNLWLNLAVETGILGLAAALWVAARAILAWRRQPGDHSAKASLVAGDELGRSIIAALWAGLLVDQFADNTLFSISTSAALWLLLALVFVPARISVPPASVHQSPANSDSET